MVHQDVLNIELINAVLLAGQESENSFLVPREKLEKKFGQSPVFVASTLQENGGTARGVGFASCLSEAMHVISCGYEDKTDWGKEVMLSSHECQSLSYHECSLLSDNYYALFNLPWSFFMLVRLAGYMDRSQRIF